MFCRARFLWAPSRWCTARLPRHLCAICASLLPLLGRAGRPCAAWNIPPKKGARVAAAKEEMASQVSASTRAKGNANVGCPFRWCFRRTINNVAAICYYCCVFPSRPITPFLALAFLRMMQMPAAELPVLLMQSCVVGRSFAFVLFQCHPPGLPKQVCSSENLPPRVRRFLWRIYAASLPGTVVAHNQRGRHFVQRRRTIHEWSQPEFLLQRAETQGVAPNALMPSRFSQTCDRS